MKILILVPCAGITDEFVENVVWPLQAMLAQSYKDLDLVVDCLERKEVDNEYLPALSGTTLVDDADLMIWVSPVMSVRCLGYVMARLQFGMPLLVAMPISDKRHQDEVMQIIDRLGFSFIRDQPFLFKVLYDGPGDIVDRFEVWFNSPKTIKPVERFEPIPVVPGTIAMLPT
jgi:hypothetical protein